MNAPSAQTLRHILTLAPLPAVPPPPPGALAGRTVLVLGQDGELRAALAGAVRRYGGRVMSWDDEAHRPDAAGPVDVIIDAGLTGVTEVRPGIWGEPLRRTISALRYVYDDWARQLSTERPYYIAVTGMGGTMGLRPADACQPLGGLWAGLAKTLPQEFPACQVRVVDLGPTEDPGAAVLAEMFGTRLLETGHDGHRRYTILPRKMRLDGEPIKYSDSDVVLFTGGGRGIGFQIAVEMARTVGCRVVVSGRTRLPDDPPGWLTCTAEEFTSFGRREYAARRGGESPYDVRRRLDRMRQVRELWQNVRAAAAEGLPIEYRTCDVSSVAQVQDLVREFSADLACVVHNAGIDMPMRLPKKSADTFCKVVEVKVDGFLNVLAAVAGLPLKLICAVGSLTGRYGGMVGQLDYAGANEGLARTATWAQRAASYPVKVLAWPTWDGIGLITNLAAASRYMKPIGVTDGMAAWRAELTTVCEGEVGYMGAIADVRPQQLHGIPVPSDWNGRSHLLTRRYLLGEVRAFDPTSMLETTHRLDPAWAALVHDARVGGAPAVPIALVMEYLFAGSSLLLSPKGERMTTRLLRDLWVHTHALRVGDGPIDLVRRVRIEGTGAEVSLRAGTDLLAKAIAVFDPVPPPADPVPIPPGRRPLDPPVRAAVGYRWNPYLVEVEPWTIRDGQWRARVSASTPADQFMMVEPPRLHLPLSHVEAAVAISPATPDAATWRLREARLGDESGPAATVVADAARTRVQILDDADRPVLTLEEPRWI